ncbi:MAG: hypothetical protein K1Y02_06160 [Candidatus Hydrogenedentes bacterium]|nr:hypothetical protein [Candidatus Hydrogenedentota bacterium]
MKSVRRGRESDEHVMLKLRLLHLCRKAGYIVQCEEGNSDLVVCNPRKRDIACIEVERSVRHVCNNLERDFALGCNRVIIVTTSATLKRRIEELLCRRVWATFLNRILVITTDVLNDASASDIFTQSVMHEQSGQISA